MAETKRRLAAILAADVAGYSRLMGNDEQATLVMLNACRDVFRGLIAEHAGRVVDTAGDSVLAVFDSVVEATQCAAEIQAALSERNAEFDENRQMRFRIGVNLGDIIEQADGTIYGDGVNVAARLESLAEPGGVCLSGSAVEQIEGKIDLAFASMGEHEVKNIARPVRAFRIVAVGQASPKLASDTPSLPDKPSIAVLPFDNMSGDADQEYVGDGIAEDLITALSRLRWLFVAARNSTFTYKGTPVDVKRVGREMGVRYVVEGSVRRGGKRVRISAQLIDATTGNHVWAARYDRELEDIFALQDEITETILAAIEPEITAVELERALRKPPTSLAAWDHYQRGMWHMYRYTAPDNVQAQRCFERAIELDPRSSSAYSGLAYANLLAVNMDYAPDEEKARADALEAAKTAVALDNKDAMAHLALGRAYGVRGVSDYDTAIVELSQAIELNPSSALAHFALGHTLTHIGRPDEALPEFEQAMRLSPHDPNLWLFQMILGFALILLKQHEQALDWLQKSVRHDNVGFWAYANLVSCLGHMGRKKEGQEAARQLLKMKPDFSISLQPHLRNPAHLEHFYNGFLLAGLEISRASPGAG